jgi:hypothetical protein
MKSGSSFAAHDTNLGSCKANIGGTRSTSRGSMHTMVVPDPTHMHALVPLYQHSSVPSLSRRGVLLGIRLDRRYRGNHGIMVGCTPP